jgi:hypothetical protein
VRWRRDCTRVRGRTYCVLGSAQRVKSSRPTFFKSEKDLFSLQTKNGQQKCPACRVLLKSLSRNLILENIVDGVKVRCQKDGCTSLIPYSKLEEHLRLECESTKLECFMGCGTKNHRANMIAHLKNHHRITIYKLPYTQLSSRKSTQRKSTQRKSTHAFASQATLINPSPFFLLS